MKYPGYAYHSNNLRSKRVIRTAVIFLLPWLLVDVAFSGGEIEVGYRPSLDSCLSVPQLTIENKLTPARSPEPSWLEALWFWELEGKERVQQALREQREQQEKVEHATRHSLLSTREFDTGLAKYPKADQMWDEMSEEDHDLFLERLSPEKDLLLPRALSSETEAAKLVDCDAHTAACQWISGKVIELAEGGSDSDNGATASGSESRESNEENKNGQEEGKQSEVEKDDQLPIKMNSSTIADALQKFRNDESLYLGFFSSSTVQIQNLSEPSAVPGELSASAPQDCDICFQDEIRKVIRFFPIVAGIIFEKLIESRGSVSEGDYEQVKQLLKSDSVKEAFFQLMAQAFSNLKDDVNKFAQKLLSSYKDSLDHYELMIDGMVKYRKSLSELQEVLDKNSLTKGFSGDDFFMFFSSVKAFGLGKYAENSGINKLYAIAEASRKMLESDIVQSPSAENYEFMHHQLISGVFNEFGKSLELCSQGSIFHEMKSNTCETTLESLHQESLLMLVAPESFHHSIDVGFSVQRHLFSQHGIDEMLEFVKMVNENREIIRVKGIESDSASRQVDIFIMLHYSSKYEQLENAFSRYNAKLSVTSSQDDILLAIARLAKELMLLHYFGDGNKRVITFLINRELVRNNLTPSIVDMSLLVPKSTEEFAKAMKEGQARFESLKQKGYPDPFNSSEPSFHDQAQSKLHEYLNQS